MMSEQQAGQDAFLGMLWHLYGQIDKADALQKMRTKAWDHFLELGLPSRRDEVYRYIRLRNLFARTYEKAQYFDLPKESIRPHILPECQQSVLVFVNGVFSPLLSSMGSLPKKAVAVTLEEAMRTYSGFLNSQWIKALKEETDPFAAINMALHLNGLFFYLPPKTIAEVPIQLLNIIDAKDLSMLIMPRFQAFIGSQAEASFVSTHAVLSGSSYAINTVTDIAIEEDGHVQFTQNACGKGSDIWHFDAFRSTLKRNSGLKTVSVTDGAATVRNDYRVVLAGENAEALLNGVWMLDDKNEAHTHVLVDHQAPYCRSMQLFKGALGGVSHSSFEGKILVRQAAQKTEAFQLNNNLLLSERALAESKPNLEIFADDVKPSHGATVGQLDKEQIFYMKTRGFHDREAKNLLIHGFCQEVIDLIPIASVHESMQTYAKNYLSQ
jgi:Fe-S cluster assembly protein SufD